MKNNKWTVGLAAAGLISLASVAQAQDANSVQTKLATTSLSGYVSTTYHWNVDSDGPTGYSVGDANNDRFALDVISLTLASPKSAGDWGAGYNVQMWLGPNADNILGDDSDGEIAIKNAYVSLNAPVGNGIDIKLGRFDTILGMESMDYNLNPHFSHSWGYAIEPTLHDGLSASYQLTDNVGVTVLLANTIDATSNGKTTGDRKTYGLALNMTAPDSMGALSGATLDVAYINGRPGGAVSGQAVQNIYVGASIPVPVDKLSAGVAWDVRKAGGSDGTDSVLGLYLEYAASDKLTLNLRGERANAGKVIASDGWDATLTANYKLWDGVSTRLEYRLTHLDQVATGQNRVNNSLFANVIYEF